MTTARPGGGVKALGASLLDQGSRLGTLLDPAADRLYIVATLVALALRDIVPLWLVAVRARASAACW